MLQESVWFWARTHCGAQSDETIQNLMQYAMHLIRRQDWSNSIGTSGRNTVYGQNKLKTSTRQIGNILTMKIKAHRGSNTLSPSSTKSSLSNHGTSKQNSHKRTKKSRQIHLCVPADAISGRGPKQVSQLLWWQQVLLHLSRIRTHNRELFLMLAQVQTIAKQ